MDMERIHRLQKNSRYFNEIIVSIGIWTAFCAALHDA